MGRKASIITFMEFIHVSPVFNRDSIAKIGLIPNKVKLPTHLEYFKEQGMCTEDDKALYTWTDCDQNQKFIKDMIFCIVYIDPRNKLYEPEDAEAIDFRTLLDVNMSSWNNMIYDIYEVKANHPHLHIGKQLHVQTTTDDISRTTHGMPDEYAHEDKELGIFKDPQKNISIIGQAEHYFDNGLTIRIIR